MFSNNILYSSNRLSLFAEYKNLEEHRHFAKHILLAGEPFLCVVNGQKHKVSAGFIQSNVRHSFEYNGASPIFMMLIDESSDLSDNIDKLYLKGAPIAELPKQIYMEALGYFNNRALKDLDEFLIDSLFDIDIDRKIDHRIKEVIDMIEGLETLDKDLFKTMARKLALSESRFSHLFKSEVGVDFKNYSLLKKIEKTFKYVTIDNMSITRACINAGFSSSSHFSSACKNHFGISLSDFIRYQDNK